MTGTKTLQAQISRSDRPGYFAQGGRLPGGLSRTTFRMPRKRMTRPGFHVVYTMAKGGVWHSGFRACRKTDLTLALHLSLASRRERRAGTRLAATVSQPGLQEI